MPILEATLIGGGSFVLTDGHRIFVTPTNKVEMRHLVPGQRVLSICPQGNLGHREVASVRGVEGRRHMYDLTVEDWHNFKNVGSNCVLSNSPDRNYHFRPPTGEGTINCYNQVFGYIWEDSELLDYLEIALDKWNMQAPETEELGSVDTLCSRKPAWRAALLWGALVNAAQALAYNMVAEEFSYSIGGVSLDIDKSSKYMDLKRNAEEQWDKLVEAKIRTTKYMRGLKQQRMGTGVRSAFGPNTGRGILTPRSFM